MKRFLSAFCALAMLLSAVNLAVFASAEDDVAQNVQSTEATGVITLQEDTADLTVTEDTYLDLNGYDITNVVVTGGTLYCSDSKTDDYAVADGDYGKITGTIEGNVVADQGYLQIAEADGISFHCVNLEIYAMTLRPDAAGVYYTSNFAGDEKVAAQVETYGVALSVRGEPAEGFANCGYSQFTGFQAGLDANKASTTLLKNIMNESNTDRTNTNNANTKIYGRAYIQTAEGTVFGESVCWTLKELVEAIDKTWNEGLQDSQKTALAALYDSYAATMGTWALPNLRSFLLQEDAPSIDTEITLPITVEIADGAVARTVTVEKDGVSVTVEAGTKLADGAESLTLVVTPKAGSDSGLALQNNQIVMPVDVHVEGISPENTVPVTVSLGKVMPENLNLGNYKTYHVENGKANEMTLIAADAEFTAHNQYKYTLDGELTLHMATFSEFVTTVVVDNAWQGNIDYSWYDADADQLYIRNADQLAGFGAIVGGMNGQTQDSFAGKTVTLLSDIDLGDAEENNDPNKIFYPIGYYNSDYIYEKTNKAITSGFQKFEGTFDGNGNTIANFYQNTWEMKGDHEWYDANLQYFRDGMGLFGKISGGTVMNLTVKNFSSDGEITTNGVIAAYADSANGKSATFKNISIVNCNPRVYNIGNGGIVGCAGWYSRNDATVAGVPIVFNSITVDQTNKISALWDATGTSCGGILGQYYPDSECGIRFEKCHTAAIIEANNDCCSNYHYYWYRYCGMLMGSVRRNKTEGGYTVADTTGIVAEDCTYTYGNWNDYWYCELVKNTIASYTHDHQFGRLTNIEDISEISNDGGKTWLKQGDFALLDENRTCVECYHIFKNSEGELYRHFHDVADETNPNIYENFDLDGNGQLDDLKEDRQRYCLPFVQVLTGDGMGVKAIQEFEGLTLVEDGAVKSSEKFDALIENNGIIVKDASMTIPELFAVKEGAKISEATIHVFVSPVGEESTVAATYACVSDGYMENTAVTFKGEGAAKITITDYYFCTPTVIYVTVGEAVPDPVEKFQATAITNVDAEKTVTLGELFTEIADVTVNDAGVDVAVSGGTYEFVKNETDWTQSTITFTETATYTLTITDGDNCIPTERTLTVNPIDKFALVFENTEKYLYRVGNADKSTVALNLLFKALDGATVSSAEVTFTTVAGNASGTYTAKSPWTSGTIQFTGTGVVKVTIAAANANPLTLNLEVVDAVNTTGATSATSSNVVLLKDCSLSSLTVSGRYTFYGNGFTATYTGNGQYLNNGLKLGVVNVSEHGTLDGLNIKGTIYPAAYVYHSEAKEGPSDGNNRYYYQLSAVAASGNATISNCYIYGTRNNIFVNTGNVTIKDTVLECGTLANIQIQSSSDYTVTLENVTTIQHQVNATMGDTTQVMMGAGVLVGPETTSNPKIVLNGSFKQYNWVTSADANEVTNETAQAIINAAVDATDFNHTVNGETASNLGVIYMNQTDIAVTNNTGLPYDKGNVTMSISGFNVSGQVYSVKNASSSQIYSDYTTADKSVENSLYKPQFEYSSDLGGQYIAEGGDNHCYRENDTIKVMFPSGDTKVLDLAALVDIAKYSGQDLGLVITCKDSNGNPVAVNDGKITLSAADEYTITYAVTDTLFYDKDCNRIDKSISYSWNVTLSVSLKDTAVPNAEFVFNANNQKMGYYIKSSIFSTSVYQYLPFLSGLKIVDYNGATAYTRFDGDDTANGFNKVASITVTNKYSGNDALLEVKLTDGGIITAQFLARADSGGGSTYTGSIKTSNSVIYFVNDGTTSESEKTTTAAYWYVDYYKFTGNNGVEITSAQQTFNSSGSSVSTPSGSFSTSVKYTVSYDANNGNCGQTVGYATSVSASVTLPTVTRSGYIFDGWYTAASGGTYVGGAGESYTPAANITLYAQWSTPCTVTYDANGGSCDTASAKYSGTALILPAATWDGYILSGWYTAASGGTLVGAPGASYRPSGDVTLYAQWTDATVEVTVTYDASTNGGSCGTGSATAVVGNSVTLPTPNARTGYTFNGWYDAPSGGNKAGNAGASYTLTANITLYAQWTQIKYKINVTTSDKGGSWSGATEATYGQSVSGTITYTGNSSKSFTVVSASGTQLDSGSDTSCSFTMPAEDVTITIKSSSGCLAEGTMITMADGTQKPVEQVSVGDMVLTWNFMTGEYEAVPVCLAVDDGKNEYTVITLGFADNTTLRLIDIHGVFDADLNRYVYITPDNAEEFVGHNFVKLNADGTISTTKLVSYDVTTEYMGCYTIQTAFNVNCVAEGMLTQTPPLCDGYFDYFEMGGFMQYDTEKMQADIEQYGLYTYEDFADYLTYDAFMAFNGPYLKVAVGKGYFTFEYLIEQIQLFGIGIA